MCMTNATASLLDMGRGSSPNPSKLEPVGAVFRGPACVSRPVPSRGDKGLIPLLDPAWGYIGTRGRIEYQADQEKSLDPLSWRAYLQAAYTISTRARRGYVPYLVVAQNRHLVLSAGGKSASIRHECIRNTRGCRPSERSDGENTSLWPKVSRIRNETTRLSAYSIKRQIANERHVEQQHQKSLEKHVAHIFQALTYRLEDCTRSFF